MRYVKLESLPLAPEYKANILLNAEGVKPLGDVTLKKEVSILLDTDRTKALQFIKKGEIPGWKNIKIQDMKRLEEEIRTLFEELDLFYYPKEGDNYTFSKNKDRLLEYRAMIAKPGSHIVQGGRLHGYPECCIQQEIKRMEQKENYLYLPRKINLKTKVMQYNPLSEITFVSEEKLFIYHNPCVYDPKDLILCAESFKLGRLYAETTRSHSGRIYVERLLGCCVDEKLNFVIKKNCE
ncbi:MAG: hypothetical protein QMD14_02715 [Candidatus Aenigmarchaeota archaeon]|nr:hypothetical protein [Candidatus Aenigmarchaeota archaeon]